MIVAEGLLIGAWMLIWGTIFLNVKILARNSWVSTTLGTIT